MAVQISETVRLKIIDGLSNDYQPIADILADECGDNLPFCQGPEHDGLIERVRLAVLKLSHGNINQLLCFIDSAQQD